MSAEMVCRRASRSCRGGFFFGTRFSAWSCSALACRMSAIVSSLARWALARCSVTGDPFLRPRLARFLGPFRGEEEVSVMDCMVCCLLLFLWSARCVARKPVPTPSSCFADHHCTEAVTGKAGNQTGSQRKGRGKKPGKAGTSQKQKAGTCRHPKADG